MKSQKKFWLIMISVGVGLGSSAMAYSRFIEEIEAPATNGVSDKNQPPETDDDDADQPEKAMDEDDSEQDDSEQDDGISEEVDDNSNEEDDTTEASDDDATEASDEDETEASDDKNESREEGEGEGEEDRGHSESEMSDDSDADSDASSEEDRQGMAPQEEDEEEDSENPERAFEERTENLVNEINRCKERDELEQVAEFKQQLSEVVNEHFLWLESRRQQQVEALEQRLEKLKKLLEVRSKNSDKIINRRIQTLLDEPDALDWKIK